MAHGRACVFTYPLTTDLSVSSQYLAWAPSSHPKNLVTSPASRCSALATWICGINTRGQHAEGWRGESQCTRSACDGIWEERGVQSDTGHADTNGP
jgi:hypothetical protein